MTVLSGLKKFESNFQIASKIDALVIAWETTYTHINVHSQIQWAHTWLLENPKKDKKDYVRYLGNWMRQAEARALDRRTNVVVHKTYKEEKPADEEVMTGEDFKKMREAIRK